MGLEVRRGEVWMVRDTWKGGTTDGRGSLKVSPTLVSLDARLVHNVLTRPGKTKLSSRTECCI